MSVKWKLGKIKFYDKIGKEGLLECSDGSYYEFTEDALHQSINDLRKLKKNRKVKFKAIEHQNFFLADSVKEAA